MIISTNAIPFQKIQQPFHEKKEKRLITQQAKNRRKLSQQLITTYEKPTANVNSVVKN
jgi:signal recognition particle receptor subunit beta